MKITSISYQAVKNLGNYESERLEANADVEAEEDPKDAVLKLRQFVHEQLVPAPEFLFESPGLPKASLDDNPLFDELDPERF